MNHHPPFSDTHQATGTRPSLWVWIQEKINLALYRPKPAEGVVVSRLNGREGIYYVLRAPDAGSYLKLTAGDYYLWTQMDGQRNVKDLVVAYLLNFGAFAFDRVSQLVRELRRGGFLVDRPVEVLAHIQAKLETQELVSRGERLTSIFVHQEVQIPGIDRFLNRLYRYTSWLFALPVQILFLIIVIAGLFVFIDTVAEGEVPLLTAGGSYWLGLLALLVINAGVILVHELAHGLTTKRFGRQVRRGGFLIYYGYPAFFVDTMDMWLESRWARIAVSWAGPHSGLILGGLCALLVRAFPESALTPWLFKLAFVAFLGVFFNLNPLLELDGYFILIDLLELPMLRQRAFSFIRHHVWNELRGTWRSWRRGQADWRAGFTQEERLLATFGLLAAAYTLYSVWVAIFFWQSQIVVALRELWNRSGWPSKLLLFLVLGAIVITLSAALFAQLVAWGRRVWAWVEKKDVFESDRNVTIALLALLALLILGPVLVHDPWWSRYLALMTPALLAVAAVFLVRTAWRYQGAEFQRVFWALLAAVALLWLAALLRVPAYLRYARFSPDLTAGTNNSVLLLASTNPEIGWADNLERLAAIPLFVAGFLGLSGVDIRRGAAWERVSVAALVVTAGLVAVTVARWMSGTPLADALLSVSAAYLTLVFLATALPNLTGFARTGFFVPWLALTSAALLTGTLGVLRVLPNPPGPTSDLDRWLGLVAAVFWALGAVAYDLAGHRMRFKRTAPTDIQIVSEEERLRQAFARFFAAVFDSFREAFGNRRAQALDEEMDVISGKADGGVELDGGRIRDQLALDRMTVWEQADRYREVLERVVDLMDDWSGSIFVARATQAAYDSLPWPEREVLGRYVLSGTEWGAAIAAQFATHQDVRWRLVRALPLFAHCNERALNLIVGSLESQRVPSGTVLARQGVRVDRFFLVQSGEIEVWQRDETTSTSRVTGELRRGASLGDQAFFGVGQYEATYRASAPSELLTLDAAGCDRLVRSGVALATRVGASLEVVRLLSGMPLFGHLSPQQLSSLASTVRRRTTLGSQVLAHVGAERHSLFIVVDGVVEALADDANGDKFVAHVYTSGEHFGEYALFTDTPYQFTYRSQGPATLLTLDEAIFDALVAQSKRMACFVEQVGSGRMLTVQHRSR